MKNYEVMLEISGPTAMWTRPDTGDAPVSYPAPTYSAVKGIFESGKTNFFDRNEKGNYGYFCS